MALSAGMRQAFGVATGWLALACAASASLVYFHDVKGTAHALLGLQAPHFANRAAAPARTSQGNLIVEIKAGAHGHYFASAQVNGRPIDVLVDSGASIVALTFDDAR